MGFKEGDIVQIVETSKYWMDNDNSNPKNCNGRITYFISGVFRVKWDNGCTNVYGDYDLISLSDIRKKKIINLLKYKCK